jgi:hypothetical protein
VVSKFLAKKLLISIIIILIVEDFKQNIFINYFAEIYSSKVSYHRLIDETCNIDLDCFDTNAQCTDVCIYCGNSVKVCKCRPNYFEAINLSDNNKICGKCRLNFQRSLFY